MILPRIFTLPLVGAYTPVTTLKAVVLPAPLGPMSPVMDPVGIRMDRSLTAVIPPKRMVTCCTSSSSPF